MRHAPAKTIGLALAAVLTSATACRTGAPVTPIDSYVARGEYQEAGMLACRPGYAVAGLRMESNQLLCRRVVADADTARLESTVDGPPATVRADMHACPTGQYVRGVHVLENRLLCSRDPREAGGARLRDEGAVGAGYEEAGIQACPLRDGRVTVLTGVHATRRQYLCSGLRP